MEAFGISAVASITVIAYLVGKGVKATPFQNDHLIPLVCGTVGGVLGLLGFFLEVPSFPASDFLTALAVGIVSGLSATGVNQIGKQLST